MNRGKWMSVGVTLLAPGAAGCGSSRLVPGSAATTTGTDSLGESYGLLCSEVVGDLARSKSDVARHNVNVAVNDLTQLQVGLAKLRTFLSPAQRVVMARVLAEYQAAITAIEDDASGHHAAARAQMTKVFAIRKTINANLVANFCPTS